MRIINLKQKLSGKLGIHGKLAFIAATGSIAVIAFVLFMIYGNLGSNKTVNATINTFPVKLIRFNGVAKDAKIVLTWVTATEVNNDYFTVEKSKDGINFIEYGKVDGTGNTTTAQEYSYDDLDPFTGTNYYRLKQTNYNKKTKYFKVLSVIFNLELEGIEIRNIRPNPFEDEFTIDFDSEEEGECEILLLDLNGRIISKNKIKAYEGYNDYRFLETEKLKDGIYYVKIFKGSASSKAIKIVKQ